MCIGSFLEIYLFVNLLIKCIDLGLIRSNLILCDIDAFNNFDYN